jgi:hypothetical protein
VYLHDSQSDSYELRDNQTMLRQLSHPDESIIYKLLTSCVNRQ